MDLFMSLLPVILLFLGIIIYFSGLMGVLFTVGIVLGVLIVLKLLEMWVIFCINKWG